MWENPRGLPQWSRPWPSRAPLGAVAHVGESRGLCRTGAVPSMSIFPGPGPRLGSRMLCTGGTGWETAQGLMSLSLGQIHHIPLAMKARGNLLDLRFYIYQIGLEPVHEHSWKTVRSSTCSYYCHLTNRKRYLYRRMSQNSESLFRERSLLRDLGGLVGGEGVGDLYHPGLLTSYYSQTEAPTPCSPDEGKATFWSGGGGRTSV